MFGFGNYAGTGVPPGKSLPFGNADAFVRVVDGSRLVFRDCTWSIVSGLKTTQAAWSVLASANAVLAWEIKTYQYAVHELSWRIMASALAVDSSWLIQNATVKPLSWGVLTRTTGRSVWIVLNGVATAPSWRVLCAGPLVISWGVEAARTFPSGWKLSNRQAHSLSWGVANTSGRSLSWGNLAAKSVNVAFATLNIARSELAARVLVTRPWPSGWRIQPALLAAFAWDIRGGTQAEIGWEVEAILETEIASRILGSASVGAAWDVFAYERLAVEVSSRIMTRKSGELSARILHGADRTLVARILNAYRQRASWAVVARRSLSTDLEVLPRAKTFNAGASSAGHGCPSTFEATPRPWAFDARCGVSLVREATGAPVNHETGLVVFDFVVIRPLH